MLTIVSINTSFLTELSKLPDSVVASNSIRPNSCKNNFDNFGLVKKLNIIGKPTTLVPEITD